MNETIKLILSLSISGSILAVIIFAIKPFIKHRLSKAFQYYIWIVVLLRLIMPFSFDGSIMNYMFYNDKTAVDISAQGAVKAVADRSDNIGSSYKLFNVKENVISGVYNGDVNHSNYFKDLFNQYVLYIWLLGITIALSVNLIGYARFLKHLKQTNRQVTQEQNRILTELLKESYKVGFVRNQFVTTPMLIGIRKPYIVIPDIDFNETQLKNILLHELSHLKRLDIVIKWLVMIAASIHWFNPLMHFIKKEVNNACELACDEAVIKNLNAQEKQAYGDTLISVVAEQKYTAQVLQATMCEEKKSLKERLLAIMNHSKKSRFITVVSIVLLTLAITGAIVLGARVNTSNDNPPKIYISAEGMKTKVALIGTYSWKNRGVNIQADSDQPTNFNYKSDNIVNVNVGQQIVIGTQKLKSDKKYDFKIKDIVIYKVGLLEEVLMDKGRYDNGNYYSTPLEQGEYIYSLTLNYEDKGTVNYGFVVRVDMISYNLEEIYKYKTPYIGNNSKVSAIVSNVPAPSKDFNQKYISLETKNKPYKLNVYYEAKKDSLYSGEWPVIDINNINYSNMEKNALVLFSMIGNMDEVTFAFRNSESEGSLDTSKYNATASFKRENIETIYGDLSALAENSGLLQDKLMRK
jgi:beta-lactamase regulating signal transducer with metallopeptidase domain